MLNAQKSNTMHKATLLGAAYFGLLMSSAALAQSNQLQIGYTYDNLGRVSQSTDPMARTYAYTYDRLGRVTKQTLPESSAINFSYDLRDQITGVTDGRSSTTTYAKSGLGQTLATGSPDTGSATKSYDTAGNLVVSADARGKTNTYLYDNANRLVQITYTSGEQARFEYDGGPGGAQVEKGKLTRMANSSVTTNLTHDGLGNLLSREQIVNTGGGTYSRTIAYDYGTSGPENGKVITMTYPSGMRVHYAYDLNGAMSAISVNPPNGYGGADTASTQILISDIVYHPSGRPLSWKFGGTDSVNRTYDLTGRMTGYTLSNSVQGTIVRTLTYDAGGRISGYQHTGTADASSLNQTFTYDLLDRLTSQTVNGVVTSYQYDANGNRIKKTAGSVISNYSYANTGNRLLGISGGTQSYQYTYDSSGNITGDGVRTFIYDERGRLASASSVQNGTATYTYSAAGERVAVSTAAGPRYFVYEGSALIGEYAPTGDSSESIYFQGALIGYYTDRLAFVYTDHIATPRTVVDATDHSVLWRWDAADAFGASAAVTSGRSIAFNHRFPGQYSDIASGAYYNYFRDYDPQTGRYIQSDPIGLNGGINTYAYVEGNPVSFVDPFGLEAHVNLLDFSLSGRTAGSNYLYEWADHYRPSEYNTIVIHGIRGSDQFSTGVYKYSGTELGKVLKTYRDYDSKKPTLLIACEAGANGKSGPQAVADALGKGRIVYAAPETLNPGAHTGNHYGNPYVFGSPGQTPSWQTYIGR